MMPLPKFVNVSEVGPRDGFQMEKQFIPTDAMIEFVNALARRGIRQRSDFIVSLKLFPDAMQPSDGWISLGPFTACTQLKEQKCQGRRDEMVIFSPQANQK
jgi:hypothetical protein